MAFAASRFPGQAEPRDWLEMATRGGARALGQQARLGQLAPGREASFQVVRLPERPALHELEEALCTAGRNVHVTHLYLAARNVLPQR
jgi:5-methylthioadenosine/S-adenosylhomocysteine deaminase